MPTCDEALEGLVGLVERLVVRVGDPDPVVAGAPVGCGRGQAGEECGERLGEAPGVGLV